MLPEFSEKNFFIEDNNTESIEKKVELLFDEQLKNWKLAADGYKSLEQVQIKKFQFDNYSVEAHFNPGRIISSSAKVDAKSINERPCFLCLNNLPQEQKAIRLHSDYILLINPYPIFNKHLTIPSLYHIPQSIKNKFEDLLIISSKLGKNFSVFYNGPKCGASAPDHLHFQAGNFGFMNIDNEYGQIINQYSKIFLGDNKITVSMVTGCLRNFISLESTHVNSLINWFKKIFDLLNQNNSDEEPMLNIICSYDSLWRVLIFPRSRHRPTYFFEEGENKLLISPAAVDLGGVLIFPREEDFHKLTKEIIEDIFNQVTINENELRNIFRQLR